MCINLCNIVGLLIVYIVHVFTRVSWYLLCFARVPDVNAAILCSSVHICTRYLALSL